VKVDKKYIGDRVQRKLGPQEKPVYGTIIEMRQGENLGRYWDTNYQDERHMVYLVRWDNPCKEKYSWVVSYLLVPLWPEIIGSVTADNINGSR
jgi:hypothetical protein